MYLVLLHRKGYWRVYDIPRFDFDQHATSDDRIEWLIGHYPPVQMYVERANAEAFADELIEKRQRHYDYVVLKIPEVCNGAKRVQPT